MDMHQNNARIDLWLVGPHRKQVVQAQELLPVPETLPESKDANHETDPQRRIARIVDGDLLRCGACMIVQQTNCVTTKAHGLSLVIARTYSNANPYQIRHCKSPNTALEPEIPGRCLVMRQDEDDGPLLACLHAQWAPGRTGTWHRRYPRLSDQPAETKRDRMNWFKSCLADLRGQLWLFPNVRQIAFPHGIGCGLAGGRWDIYKQMIMDWAATVTPDVIIVRKQ